MLTSIHFLLTYTCTYECDHCFLYCSPGSEGTFTLKQIRKVLDDATNIPSMNSVYFEGGEPFLFYPIMLEGMKIAHEKGYKIGIVSNAYWGNSVEDSELWLKPLTKLNISDLSLSNDQFHSDDEKDNPAVRAGEAAKNLGLPVGTICIEAPTVARSGEKGEPVVGGGAMFRGRAVEKLIEGLPKRPWRELNSCPHEELESPKRVHIDSFGNVHICQGISMGNMWETPLFKLDADYDANKHPICGPLLRGGPAELARDNNIDPEDEYVDECHMCFLIRKALLDRYPDYLCPAQVYGE
jgi:hypothetical protein